MWFISTVHNMGKEIVTSPFMILSACKLHEIPLFCGHVNAQLQLMNFFNSWRGGVKNHLVQIVWKHTNMYIIHESCPSLPFFEQRWLSTGKRDLLAVPVHGWNFEKGKHTCSVGKPVFLCLETTSHTPLNLETCLKIPLLNKWAECLSVFKVWLKCNCRNY